MQIADRKFQQMMSAPTAALSMMPFARRRCDTFGCDQVATRNCSGHGVHFCACHFEDHRSDWHAGQWESALPVGRA